MEQLSIFDFIRPDGIDVFFQDGAMYAFAPKGSFAEEPVELGDKTIYPGQYVSRLGEKDRTSFLTDMNEVMRFMRLTILYIETLVLWLTLTEILPLWMFPLTRGKISKTF